MFSHDERSVRGATVGRYEKMGRLSDSAQRTRRALHLLRRRIVALACAGLLAQGCAFSQTIGSPRSSTDQLLTTVAIDRALAKLAWPDVAGKAVVIQLGAPDESFDRDYLLRSIEIGVAQRGGVLVDVEDEADYQLNVLVGAVGVDVNGRFFGLKGTQGGGLIPFTIPELALYRTQRLAGFAKLELALLDHRSGGVVHRSGPEMAATSARSRTLLFVFHRRWTDVTRFESGEPSDAEAY